MSSSTEILWESPDCPLCGSRDAALWLQARDRIYGNPGLFRLTRCRQCRHVYLNPRPNAASISAFYPEDYGPHHLVVGNGSETVGEGRPTIEARAPWYLSPLARRIVGLRAAYY